LTLAALDRDWVALWPAQLVLQTNGQVLQPRF
jgi:hypothetical protein